MTLYPTTVFFFFVRTAFRRSAKINMFLSCIEQYSFSELYTHLFEIHLSSGKRYSWPLLCFLCYSKPIHFDSSQNSYVLVSVFGGKLGCFGLLHLNQDFFRVLLSPCSILLFSFILGLNAAFFHLWTEDEQKIRIQSKVVHKKEGNKEWSEKDYKNKTKDHPLMSSSFPLVSLCCSVITIADFLSPPASSKKMFWRLWPNVWSHIPIWCGLLIRTVCSVVG